MKVIKPLTQSLLYKVFEADNKFYLCSSVLSYFQFDHKSLLPETELWKFIASELGKDAMIDQCMPKPGGEVLVTGKCFPSGESTNADEVLLSICGISKRLFVFGNRFWKKNKLMQWTISDPGPFTEMSISWEYAFGGRGYKPNPLGKGHTTRKAVDGGGKYPLPNIEYPDALIGSVKDNPEPAGFGPVDMTWPQRMKKAGTYDENWRKELFPGLARDIDHTFFNTAPEDQWIRGFFAGDESFELKGMHPKKRVIQSRLPSMKSRCFINQKTVEGEEFKEIPTVLDTVWLFPHAEKGVCIWRGVMEIATDNAEDVLHMMVAYERIGDGPKTMAHYKDAFERRISEATGFLYLINENALIPCGEKSAFSEMLKNDKSENALTKNLNVKAEKVKEEGEKKKQEALDKIKAKLEKAGIEISTIVPPPAPVETSPAMPSVDPDNLEPEVLLEFLKKAGLEASQRQEKALAESKNKKEQAEKKIKDACEKQGLDYNVVMSKLKERKPKRPVFSARESLSTLKTAREAIENKIKLFCSKTGVSFETILVQTKLAPDLKSFPLLEAAEKIKRINPDDPELIGRLEDAELKSREMYCKTAHYNEKPEPPDSCESTRLRDLFIEKLRKKEKLSGQDFAGADLHGLDMKNCNLAQVYLEGADLSHADLTGADLSGAVLAWANLTDAKLHNAVLHNASLGGADCTRAEFHDADCTGCIIAKANLTGSDFEGGDLGGVDLTGATFSSTRFRRTRLPGVIFMETGLDGTDFSGADLSGAIISKSKLDKADFTGADLAGVNCIDVSCVNALFTGADCSNARFLLKSNLSGANFVDANLENANLMEADLSGACFDGARLSNANLMHAVCKKTNLTGAVAKRANCMKTDFEGATLAGANLMEANMKGARLVQSDIRKANMFSAELFRVVLGNTQFDGTNLKKTKIADWRPDDKG